MAFNFKAFATAFMDDQAKAIQKRIQDAEEYEDEQGKVYIREITDGDCVVLMD